MDKKYMQFYKKLRDEIVAGIYAYGDKIPSKRVFAADNQSSVITVEHAYDILCEEGYIESKARSGYFVIYKASESFSAPKEEALFIPSDDRFKTTEEMFPFSVLARRARFVISEYGEKILIKSPNCGCPILTNAICSYLARNRGINVNPQQIIIGSGAEYLYGLVAKLLGKDKIFGTEFPSYTQIQSVYEANGITCEPLTLGKHGILSEELSKTGASVLHITPYRSYPSGVTATASKRREYLQWVSQKDRYIIEDDYESEFSVSSKVEDTLFAMDSLERVIYINTFSKTISPAIRVGYMVLPKPLALQFQSQLGFLSCTVSTFEQYMVASLINSGDFERHINKVRRKKRKSLESK